MQKLKTGCVCRSLRIEANKIFRLDFGYILEKLKQKKYHLYGDKQSDEFTFYIFTSPDRGGIGGVSEGKQWHSFQNGTLSHKSDNKVINCQSNNGEVNGLRVFITNGAYLDSLEKLFADMSVDEQILILTQNGFTEISFYGLQEAYMQYVGGRVFTINDLVDKGYVFCIGSSNPENNIISDINLLGSNEMDKNSQYKIVKDSTMQNQPTTVLKDYSNMNHAPSIDMSMPFVCEDYFVSPAKKLENRDFKFDLCYVIKSVYAKDKQFIKNFQSDKFQFFIFTKTKRGWDISHSGKVSFIKFVDRSSIIEFSKSLEILDLKIFIRHCANENEFNSFDKEQKEQNNVTMENLRESGFEEIGIYWHTLRRKSVSCDPLKDYVECRIVIALEHGKQIEKLADIDLFSNKNCSESIVERTNAWREMRFNYQKSSKDNKPMLDNNKFKKEQK